ncbi:MAG: DUF4982 domain-containing protein [Prevotella sp.]|nr:DUF4982 domain-containing protein [Prevotella sp.]
MKKTIFLIVLFTLCIQANGVERVKYNFNSDWLLQIGDIEEAQLAAFDDSQWQHVTLPRAFNEDEAFRLPCPELSDTVMWYRKHFTLTDIVGKKFFVEFEGVRFGAEFFINGNSLGLSENGVMASGFDLTPYIKDGENVLAVRVDNSWVYRERSSNSRYQWNDKNFNANYGGIPKNVYLHVSDVLYQTLPLYSNLGTTGTYIYGTDYDIPAKTFTLHAESQVRNDDTKARSFRFFAKVLDADGKEVGHFDGERYTLQPGETRTVTVTGQMKDVHFWSWGYGYLYTVKTLLKADDGSKIDDVITRTGFRKTRFAEGKIWLNDRVMMVHGYAQRTSNEWPGVGMSVPAWLSDYSNKLVIESGGNVMRWMHVTPWKQDVESCDRVGLIHAMPAGDAEKDVEGRRWEQRVDLMRDAIIYNRNNPSILFYEGGNESISREHMIELKNIRDKYDPHGGRAIGSREMLDIDEAEYGGEMLYINKSKKHPMWQMEYCRDEGLRKYWDEYSYPFHKEGDGPLYRGKPAIDYNHNMDEFAKEMVERWYDYFVDRPGTGKRVNSGGVKIVFSDTNTHWRGESNYRTSGVTDAMRIPKDAFFAHQVMWDGWVAPEEYHTYIIGHWNYDKGVTKDIYVVSNGDDVELFINGKSLGKGERKWQYLFTFKDVAFEEGTIEAISYKDGERVSDYCIETAGKPDHLVVSIIQDPLGFKADGADMALVQVEVVDKEGRRCPLDNRMVNFNLWGEGQWIGGIATKPGMKSHKNGETEGATNAHNGTPGMLDGPSTVSTFDNYVRQMGLPVECGINRVLVRSTVNPGKIYLTAAAEGLSPVTITLETESIDTHDGVSTYLPAMALPLNLERGETPSTPSYRDMKRGIDVKSAKAGSNQDDVLRSFDDNELSEWKSDGTKENAWITYQLEGKRQVDEIAIKLTGWRNKCYPLAIYQGKKKVWEGITYATLGYVHIPIDKPVISDVITIKMLGPAQDSNAFGDTKELAGGNAGELDRFVSKGGKVELRIVEIDFLEFTK